MNLGQGLFEEVVKEDRILEGLEAGEVVEVVEVVRKMARALSVRSEARACAHIHAPGEVVEVVEDAGEGVVESCKPGGGIRRAGCVCNSIVCRSVGCVCNSDVCRGVGCDG